MAGKQIKVAPEVVLQAKQDFQDALDRFNAVANQFASDVEASGAAWGGEAQMAALNTGIHIHTDLGRVTTWGLTLIGLVGDHVAHAVDNEAQSASTFGSLLGGSGTNT
jgi:hypothetical protein